MQMQPGGRGMMTLEDAVGRGPEGVKLSETLAGTNRCLVAVLASRTRLAFGASIHAAAGNVSRFA